MPDQPSDAMPGTPRALETLEASIGQIAALLESTETLDDGLRRIAVLATSALPACALADITLISDGVPGTKGATHPRAEMLDAVQYTSGQGPCIDAWRLATTVHVPSTRTDTRWPEFARAAVAAGVLSTLAVPLATGGETVGALNLHAEEEASFTDDDQVVARLFANQAALAIRAARTHAELTGLVAQLEDALQSRGPIEQAKGIVMAQLGVGPDEAFEHLVTRSQHENRKLRDVAQSIVESVREAS